ncbi:MAG: chromate efflux transporter [Chloroflexaceae bacterium]|jgi:chromate transporter|nr:chromate efflux transporter [Chloroflexaceae bacterium]
MQQTETFGGVAAESHTPVRVSLAELARYFLILGCTAFGGPAAHIAIMQRDLVEKRRWLSKQYFLDSLAATQLVPGPNSTEMAIHVGYAQRGVAGLFVAGACFILPAFMLVLAISIGYVAFETLPQVQALFYGIQPVIVAIVILAAYQLGKTACRTLPMLLLAAGAALITLVTRLDTVWVIVGGGLVGVLLLYGPKLGRAAPLLLPFSAPPGLPAMLERMAQAEPDAPLWQLGLFFLKVGATLMGSGYVLVSYLENDLVRGYGWLTHQQLVDSIAVGQMTPGPVFTTAAFVGYVIQAGPEGDVWRGTLGAAVCALAIFLPSFFIVWAMAPWIPRLRQSKLAGAFLDGVNAAVVGSIAATTWTLLLAAAVNLPRPVLALPIGGASLDIPALLLVAIATGLLLYFKKLNSTWLILGGALLGLILHMFTR